MKTFLCDKEEDKVNHQGTTKKSGIKFKLGNIDIIKNFIAKLMRSRQLGEIAVVDIP